MENTSFVIDQSISQELREKIFARVKQNVKQAEADSSERDPIYRKRADFYEGRHHNWTNVVGQGNKKQEGHILAVFNYVYRFCRKLSQSLTNVPPMIKVQPEDEANEIETSRSEAVEKAIHKVFKDNLFWSVLFKKLTDNQIRDGDFSLDCVVKEDDQDGKKKIIISANENMLKMSFGWDDASGTSYSFAAYTDMWSLAKIKRDFNYDAEPYKSVDESGQKRGDHLSDQYGLMASVDPVDIKVPSGENKLPKAKVVDYWGYEMIENKSKVINVILINDKPMQLMVTDYKRIPKFIGHSFLVAGKPYSKSFIDDLVDPQIELNDRMSEEGDLVRIGSHMKFLAINLQDFDPTSVSAGSGQVIFIEGENADFRPLPMNITTFPSDSYINRAKEALFDLGIPKIGLAAGTAPYTGKVGAIQYQPIIDTVAELRIQWEVVLTQLTEMIQQYFIDYFPEMAPVMAESIYDETTGTYTDGDPVIRKIDFDWDNILPLSRSDKVVDASTMRDRSTISLYTYLEQVGFRDPSKEIKRLKKEFNDQELVSLLAKFQQFSPGAVKAQLDAQRAQVAAQEEMAGESAAMSAPTETNTSTPAPILNQSQNEGRRGISSSTGTPTGQTATPKGAIAKTSQNMNAANGV